MKSSICVSLVVCSLLMGCERFFPEESWKGKGFDFLISKLKDRNIRARGRAIWYLQYYPRERDRVINELTHTLLNDKREEVRSEAARVLGLMTPPAAEAVPALIEALNLPKKDRGQPQGLIMQLDVPPLLMAVGDALESIGTPDALKAIEEFKKLGPKLIESSVKDGASGVDPESINKNGITLRFRGNASGNCSILTADGKIICRKSFKKNSVSLKPRRGDPKLVNEAVYKVEVSLEDDSFRSLSATITFTTKW